MGIPASPELLAIAMVYFVQGILGISRLAITFFMKDDLHLDPASVTFLTGLGSAPWLVKPLYGFLSDTVPIAGYRRRSYLLLCGLVSACGWAYLATVANSPSGVVLALIAGNLGSACSDVVVDSIVVERARGQPQVGRRMKALEARGRGRGRQRRGGASGTSGRWKRVRGRLQGAVWGEGGENFS